MAFAFPGGFEAEARYYKNMLFENGLLPREGGNGEANSQEDNHSGNNWKNGKGWFQRKQKGGGKGRGYDYENKEDKQKALERRVREKENTVHQLKDEAKEMRAKIKVNPPSPAIACLVIIPKAPIHCQDFWPKQGRFRGGECHCGKDILIRWAPLRTILCQEK